MDHTESNDIATTITATPILNSPDFKGLFGGDNGSSLPLDETGLFRPLETILFPGSRVKITARLSKGIYSIVSSEYFAIKQYVDARFLKSAGAFTEERLVKMPSIEALLDRLEKLLGIPYVWGGNYSRGVPEMLEYYPPKKALSPEIEVIWTMKGVDCSGLLYEVTQGGTPRNTVDLLNYGLKVKIEDKSPDEILPLLKPLDLIVWKGHVVIIFDETSCIESRAGFGVIKTPLEKRLREVLQEKKPVDFWDTPSDFVIRRWHPETRF